MQPSSWRNGAGRWALAVLVGCVALLAFGPLATAQAAGTASITGTVTAAKGGAALKGIEVTAIGPGGSTTTTDASGKYTISLLEKGEYTVRFSDPSLKYLAREEQTTIAVEGEAKTLNAKMKESGSITGRVTSAATGSGLGNVTVSVSGPSPSQTTTEANGDYTITDLSPGNYEVEFSAFELRYVSQRTSRLLGEGAVEVNAALTEGGKISGRVTDAVTHGGLAKISVSASSSSGFGSASTNANGEYTVTGLPTGSYKVAFAWEFSESEVKEFEKAPRFVPKYITQYFSGQPSEATANPVGATEGTVTSGINAAMVPALPDNTALPVVSGTPAVGSPLSCSSGSWTGEPELKLSIGWPLTSPFGYQWLRDGVTIVGATSDTYVVQAADVGHGLVCEVTATNDAGHASAKSSSFAVVKPVPVVKILGSKFGVTKGTTKVGIACASAPCVGAVKAVEMIVVKHRKGKKTITKKQTLVLAAGSYSLAAGNTGTITLRLTAAGTKQLAHASHHRVSPKLVVSVAGGKQLEETVQLSRGH
jgi:Carboxypeptidase regulatory-like domain